MRARPELLPRLNGWLPGGDIYDLMVGMGIGFVDNNQMLCAFSMRNRGTQPTMFTPGTTASAACPVDLYRMSSTCIFVPAMGAQR
eukprot:scaffold167282_cov24-Tisochrysis_lutea.AAC.1